MFYKSIMTSELNPFTKVTSEIRNKLLINSEWGYLKNQPPKLAYKRRKKLCSIKCA
jgi:hypothetical protein